MPIKLKDDVNQDLYIEGLEKAALENEQRIMELEDRLAKLETKPKQRLPSVKDLFAYIYKKGGISTKIAKSNLRYPKNVVHSKFNADEQQLVLRVSRFPSHVPMFIEWVFEIKRMQDEGTWEAFLEGDV